MSNSVIGGIEGGATHSNIVLLDSDGNILSNAEGPGTNHHLIGMVECRRRIADMVNKAKTLANVPSNQPLQALGLSLSGCEQEGSNQELANGFKETYPHLSETYVVASDTEGSLATISNCGGITCIAGTGSNTLLINPDGSKAQCGGWGYLLGDEGSAWRIAHRAIKYCFDHLDNYEGAPYAIDVIWQTIKEHFGIQTQADILDSFYRNFDKAHIAALCKKIANLANGGDQLSLKIFEEAGNDLAKSIVAVVPRAAAELRQRPGGLRVLCVGSVWLSWELLKPGFIGCLSRHLDVDKVALVKLTTAMGVGAAYLAADRTELQLKRNYPRNYQTFFKYDRQDAFYS